MKIYIITNDDTIDTPLILNDTELNDQVICGLIYGLIYNKSFI